MVSIEFAAKPGRLFPGICLFGETDIANPWDPLPYPETADGNQNQTYYGVGLIMTMWESIEFEFARLYSILVGDEPDGVLMREYGQPRIFRERLKNLNDKAEIFFVTRCDQILEGDYWRIATAAKGFSSRRNEIAHGIVMNVSGIGYFQQRMPHLRKGEIQTIVVPPFQTLRFHDDVGMPLYAYNSEQMEWLAAQMFEVVNSTRNIRKRLVGLNS